LQLLDDLWLVESSLDTLVVEQHNPEATGCVGLDLRILELLLTQEREKARQEVRIAHEVQLV
jgi:hypothetical protein